MKRVTEARQFLLTTNVGEPVNGWQYRIVQTKPGYAPDCFRAERVDAFPPERKGREECVGYADSREKAEAYCRKAIKWQERLVDS